MKDRTNDVSKHPEEYSEKEIVDVLFVLKKNKYNKSKTAAETGVPVRYISKWQAKFGKALFEVENKSDAVDLFNTSKRIDLILDHRKTLSKHTIDASSKLNEVMLKAVEKIEEQIEDTKSINETARALEILTKTRESMNASFKLLLDNDTDSKSGKTVNIQNNFFEDISKNLGIK